MVITSIVIYPEETPKFNWMKRVLSFCFTVTERQAWNRNNRCVLWGFLLAAGTIAERQALNEEFAWKLAARVAEHALIVKQATKSIFYNQFHRFSFWRQVYICCVNISSCLVFRWTNLLIQCDLLNGAWTSTALVNMVANKWTNRLMSSFLAFKIANKKVFWPLFSVIPIFIRCFSCLGVIMQFTWRSWQRRRPFKWYTNFLIMKQCFLRMLASPDDALRSLEV